MSATGQGGVTLITGTNHATLSPVTIPVGEQLVFNHNVGRRAFSVLVTSSDGQVLTGADGLVVTQADENSITVANTSPSPVAVFVSCRWEEPTPELDLVSAQSPKIMIEQLPIPDIDESFEYAGGWPGTIPNGNYYLAYVVNPTADIDESFEAAGGWPGT